MSIEYFFSEQDVQNLVNKNNTPEFGPRNSVLVMSGVCWGLTPLEQLEGIEYERQCSNTNGFCRLYSRIFGCS